jgi:pantoate--beta-alanine ligase
MQIFRDILSLQKSLKKARIEQKSVGFVPTMGALHNGHASLITQSMGDNDITICSIFVNPTQFNNQQDLLSYPRTIEIDIDFLRNLGCDILFNPQPEEIYLQPAKLIFDFGVLDKWMEGAHRQGHFNGVALIVSKLFNIVNPDRAYFGQKDLQQFKIVSQLVQDLSFSVELKCVPIIREQDGLAMSSRNVRLTEDGRKRAAGINKILKEAESLLLNKNTFAQIRDRLISELQTSNIEVEYFEFVDAESLEQIENKFGLKSVALCIAAVVDGVRLIDNRVF